MHIYYTNCANTFNTPMFPCMDMHLTVEVCPMSTCLHTPVSASQTWQTGENYALCHPVSISKEGVHELEGSVMYALPHSQGTPYHSVVLAA